MLVNKASTVVAAGKKPENNRHQECTDEPCCQHRRILKVGLAHTIPLTCLLHKYFSITDLPGAFDSDSYIFHDHHQCMLHVPLVKLTIIKKCNYEQDLEVFIYGMNLVTK